MVSGRCREISSLPGFGAAPRERIPMKSILIIGLGRFGRHLCQKFMSLHNEVMIVDRDEAAVSAFANDVTSRSEEHTSELQSQR